MRRLALAALLVVAVLQSAAAAEAGGGAPAAGRAPREVDALPQLQSDVLHAVNAFRRAKGLPPLRASAALSATALRHSLAMAELGFFGHAGPRGAPFWRRIQASYRPGEGVWSVGENIVWASPALSAQQAIDLWLASPPHRRNLLDAAWRDVGVGAVQALGAPGVYHGLDVTIVTVDFGVR
jgi:uncharacterized protein YkwD